MIYYFICKQRSKIKNIYQRFSPFELSITSTGCMAGKSPHLIIPSSLLPISFKGLCVICLFPVSKNSLLISFAFFLVLHCNSAAACCQNLLVSSDLSRWGFNVQIIKKYFDWKTKCFLAEKPNLLEN